MERRGLRGQNRQMQLAQNRNQKGQKPPGKCQEGIKHRRVWEKTREKKEAKETSRACLQSPSISDQYQGLHPLLRTSFATQMAKRLETLNQLKNEHKQTFLLQNAIRLKLSSIIASELTVLGTEGNLITSLMTATENNTRHLGCNLLSCGPHEGSHASETVLSSAD